MINSPLPLDENDPFQTNSHQEYRFCNVSLEEDLWMPEPFQYTARVEQAHMRSFRGGNSRDQMTLLAGDSGEKNAYLMGLVASSIVVGCFFILWFVVVIAIKMKGHATFGLFSGRVVRPSNYKQTEHTTGNEETDLTVSEKEVFPEPNGTMPDTESGIEASSTSSVWPEENAVKKLMDWLAFCENQKKTLSRTRVVVVGCCAGITIAGVLFCYYGMTYVDHSLHNIRIGVSEMQDLIATAITLVENVKYRQDDVQRETQEMLTSVNGICPPYATEKSGNMCNRTKAELSCDFSNIPFEVFAEGGSFSRIFKNVYTSRDYANNVLTTLCNQLQDFSDFLTSVINGSTSFRWAFWVSYVFTVILILWCVVIVYGVFVRSRGTMGITHNNMQKHFILPVFCILVFCAFVFAVAFIIASIGAAYFCFESPDPKVTYILGNILQFDGNSSLNEILGRNSDSNKTATDIVRDNAKQEGFGLGFRYARYYVNGCEPELAPFDMQNISKAIAQSLQHIQDFSNAVSSINATDFTETCGTDLTILTNFSVLSETALCGLSATIEETNDFMQCQNFQPVYSRFMYSAVCDDAQSGLAWIAATMFFIVFLSFILFVFRAGIFSVEDEATYIHRVQEQRACILSLLCRGHCHTMHEKQLEKENPSSDIAHNTANDDLTVTSSTSSTCLEGCV